MGTVLNFLNEIIVELIAAAVFAISVYFYKFVRKQKARDAEQDRKFAEWKGEFERKLKTQEIRDVYFEQKRLEAYQQIRKYAQKARDQARLILDDKTYNNYHTWLNNLLESYDQILELLHEHAFILEYYGHYKRFHSFKNALGAFKNIAKNSRSRREQDRQQLKEALNELIASYEKLIEEIKIAEDAKTPFP